MLMKDILGLEYPHEFVSSHLTPSFSSSLEMIDPALLFGVELEIEGLDRYETMEDYLVEGLVYHEDGSLRNNGGEFVTLPMKQDTLSLVLCEFFGKNEFSSYNYSDRCSVHVHANCMDLTVDQVKLVVCLYTILEKLIFEYIHPDRKDNIFCVPLYETTKSNKLLINDGYFLKGAKAWNKYTGLNIGCLYKYGTIEFRHMSGTSDVVKIIQWCDIIACLFRYARHHGYAEVINNLFNLNTSSDYHIFLNSVFSEAYLFDLFASHENYKQIMEEGIIEMKIASLEREVKISGKSKVIGNNFTWDAVPQGATFNNPTGSWYVGNSFDEMVVIQSTPNGGSF